MSQQRVSSSSSPQGAQGSKPSKQVIPAITSPIVIRSPDHVRTVKPLRSVYPFQDQADRVILTPTSNAEAGRSDPDRGVDGTLDQTVLW